MNVNKLNLHILTFGGGYPYASAPSAKTANQVRGEVPAPRAADVTPDPGMIKVLITGSSGFVGQNLISCLNKTNDICYTIGLDINPPRFIWPDLFYQSDLCADDAADRAAAIIDACRPDIVIHLAAVSTVQAGLNEKDETFKTNVGGTKAILEAVSRSCEKPFLIHASTDKVYGTLENNNDEYTESTPLHPNPHSPYDCSKAAADQLVRAWTNDGAVNAVVLRFCNLYGPMDTHLTRIVPNNFYLMLHGLPGSLNYYQDAHGQVHEFYRSMLYVGDLCTGIRSLMLRYTEDPFAFSGRIYNLGTADSVAMSDVVAEIRKAVKCDLDPSIQIISDGTQLPLQKMNYRRASEDFHFSPSTTLTDGITKTANWWKLYYMKEVKKCAV